MSIHCTDKIKHHETSLLPTCAEIFNTKRKWSGQISCHYQPKCHDHHAKWNVFVLMMDMMWFEILDSFDFLCIESSLYIYRSSRLLMAIDPQLHLCTAVFSLCFDSILCCTTHDVWFICSLECVLDRGQSSYCIRGQVRSSASAFGQVPKEELVSGVELVTEENMPQQALTSSRS